MAMQDYGQPLIAVRIKDGIFVGNVTAAQDEDFLIMNKITHVINCADTEIANMFAHTPINYLSFPWKDTPAGAVCTTVMFDDADKNVNSAVSFIDEALDRGNCVLVHSFYGVSRSPALVAAYLVVKYGWKLENALSFLMMAHQDMNIKPHFMRQLRAFGKRHSVERDVFDIDVEDTDFALDNDQWMLRNTLLNGLSHEAQKENELYKMCAAEVELGISAPRTQAARRKRIHYIDTNQGTAVNSHDTTPVVEPPTQNHADPYSGLNGGFLGSQGPVTMRSARRRDSIVCRSISPCSRRLESDPAVNAKGRQVFTLRKAQNAPRSRTHMIQGSHAILAPAAAPSEPVVTNGGAAGAAGAGRDEADTNGSSTVQITDVRRLTPPTPVRSQFAALTSSHHYRNGSPLPNPKMKQRVTVVSKQPSTTQTPQSSPPVGSLPLRPRFGVPTGSYVAPSTISSPRPRSAVVTRTGSPRGTDASDRKSATTASTSTAGPSSASKTATSTTATSTAAQSSSPTTSKRIALPSKKEKEASQRVSRTSASTNPISRTLDSPRYISLRQSGRSSSTSSLSGAPSSVRPTPADSTSTIRRRLQSPRERAFNSASATTTTTTTSKPASTTTLRRQPPGAISSGRQ